VREELGDPKQEGSLFWLALQLGWLNKVGLAAESETEEKVYAFFHPTFQEYFAALASADWDFFLPRAHDNHNPKPVSERYRIFEPQWKEVILLWLGRPYEEVAKEQKEEFIKALVEFEDGIESEFYWYQAFFLAASLIAEFEDFSEASEIVKSVVEWSFGYFNFEKHEWVTFPNPIQQGAMSVLLETVNIKAVEALVKSINEFLCKENKGIPWRAIEILEKLGQGNAEALSVLIEASQFLDEPDQEDTRPASELLWEFYKGNPQAIEALIELIHNCHDESACIYAVESLGLIGEGNSKAVAALVELIHCSQNKGICWQALNSLGRIGEGSLEAIAALAELTNRAQGESTRFQAAKSLEKIDKRNQKAIETFVDLIRISKNECIRLKAAESLLEVGDYDSIIIAELIELFQKSADDYIAFIAIESLLKIGKSNSQVINNLLKLLDVSQNKYRRLEVVRSLGIIGKGNSEAVATLAKLIDNANDKYTRYQAADSLLRIDRNHPKAIMSLVELIDSSLCKSTRRQAAESLGKGTKGNLKTVTDLIELINSSQDEFTIQLVAWCLGEIAEGNQTAAATLVNVINNSQNKTTRLEAAKSLGKIDRGNPQAVATLVEVVRNSQSEYILLQAALGLREIDENNQQAIAALVKVIQTSQDLYISWKAVNNLKEIGKGSVQAVTTLVKIIQNSEIDVVRNRAAYSLETILEKNQFTKVVSTLKPYLSAQSYENRFQEFHQYYSLFWHCAQNMTYPTFYQAWHQQEGVDNTTTSDSQRLNQAELPQSLQSAIANDPQLSQIIHLICIDRSQFIEPDRPAAEIYDQMLDQNCPECDSVPETMPALKLYWNSLNRNSDKRVVLVFYASSTNPYSEAFLTALSKFKGDICVVTSPPTPLLRGEGSKSSSGSPSSSQGEGVRGWGSLQFFAPSQAIANILEWIRAN
jgi:HEAT repeat protein